MILWFSLGLVGNPSGVWCDLRSIQAASLLLICIMPAGVEERGNLRIAKLELPGEFPDLDDFR